MTDDVLPQVPIDAHMLVTGHEIQAVMIQTSPNQTPGYRVRFQVLNTATQEAGTTQWVHMGSPAMVQLLEQWIAYARSQGHLQQTAPPGSSSH